MMSLCSWVEHLDLKFYSSLGLLELEVLKGLLGSLWTADTGHSCAAHKIGRFQMAANAYSEHLLKLFDISELEFGTSRCWC